MDRRIILEAVMGSKAYGLDTPESDEDLRCVYVAPTMQVLGLHKPVETVQTTDPDITVQEVERFISLALKPNPSVLEMLFIEDYRVLTDEGQLLVNHRNAFLSQHVRKTFGGYAKQQIKRIQRQSEGPDRRKRQAKNARHCFRLLQQGIELLATGKITVKVSNRDELFAIGELPLDELTERFDQEFAVLDATVSDLPDEPDWEAANRLLLQIRLDDLRKSA